MADPVTQSDRSLAESLRDACRRRQNALRRSISKLGMDGLLISAEKDILYLTGFIGHDSLLLLDGDEATIISDPRYDEFLDAWREDGFANVVMGVRHRLHESVAAICSARRLRAVGVQGDQLTLTRFEQFQKSVQDAEIIPTAGIVASLRMRKDEIELNTIRKAIDIQQQALKTALERLIPGMTELQLCATIEFEMKWRGAFGSSFDPIIGSGANSSIIHHMTGDARIEPGALLIDWGAIVDGYSSDMTRTFGLEYMPDRISEIYRIVLDAQLAAIDACAPGRTCAEIDAVARKVIAQAGYAEYFGHGLGHGLGLDTHEPPFFNELQADVVLEPGMVMTVEPGIYLPGVGGVRIEDDVVVTQTGCEVLSNWPKQPEEMIVQFS